MIVVSGCPRSGTSLTMEIMRTVLGQDRIRGIKFPREEIDRTKKRPNETEYQYNYRKYVVNHFEPNRHLLNEKSRDMNPNGFWEHPAFTVNGVRYSMEHSALLKEIKAEKNPSVCKIVSQGLAESDPVYIDKVVYLLRDPASVAKSQERLTRSMMIKHPETGEMINFWKGAKVIEPRMFIDVSIVAAQWFLANPEIPVCLVKYDCLVSTPGEVLNRIGDFIGEGDFMEAEKLIQVKLNRNSGYELDHPLAEEAFTVYNFMCDGDWQGVIDYAKNQSTRRSEERRQWFCLRRGMGTDSMICDMCQVDTLMRDSFKLSAKQQGIDWIKLPCGYECGYDKGMTNHKSIEDSIEHNHWKG